LGEMIGILLDAVARVWGEVLRIRNELHQSRPLAKSRIRETDNVDLDRKRKHSFAIPSHRTIKRDDLVRAEE
jgi:hypothetical protein